MRMVGGRRYDEIRWRGNGRCNKRVMTMAVDKIERQMMKQKQAADNGSGAEDDQMYLPRVFFYNCRYNSFL